MADPKLPTDLPNSEKGHDGKVDPYLIPLMVGHLNVDIPMNGDKLELGIRHDAIGIQGLPWLVEPDTFIRPP